MPRRFDRFLHHLPVRPHAPTLGRVFNVTRETWKLTDDPSKTKPRRQRLISGHTASEAADHARASAESFDEHGFHKPSGAWWAADGADFHRFVVHQGRRGPSAPVLIATGVAAVAMTALHLRGRSRKAGKRAE